MPRALWKGAISFGLVHIPVAVYPAARDEALNFDWLDRRTMDPVGYKRINKNTGKEVRKEDIVRGLEYGDGQYVVLSDDEIRAAYPKTTQTIDIDAFISPQELPFVLLERPYYLAPTGKGQKVYALLRETLLSEGRVGIARVVIQRKQHLAALAPSGPALVLDLLRWPDEIRSWEGLDLPAAGRKAAGLTERELKMAAQLVADMTTHWDPDAYRDTFRDDIMALVKRKAEAGETHEVEALEPVEAGEKRGAEVIDLTELLKRSLGGRGSGGETAHKPARRGTGTRKPASKSSSESGKTRKKRA
jgi:DNA end-binding protein Ku